MVVMMMMTEGGNDGEADDLDECKNGPRPFG